MNAKTILLLCAVPALNIFLNIQAKQTSAVVGSEFAWVLSVEFFYTMLIGTASVSCMILLYRQGVAVPRGILLMGAMSILGGTVLTMFKSPMSLTWTEWAIFATLAVLMSLRLWKAV